MLLSLRRKGPTSLFKEVWVFKVLGPSVWGEARNPGTPEESEKSPQRVPRGRAPKVPKECTPESQKSPTRV